MGAFEDFIQNELKFGRRLTPTELSDLVTSIIFEQAGWLQRPPMVAEDRKLSDKAAQTVYRCLRRRGMLPIESNNYDSVHVLAVEDLKTLIRVCVDVGIFVARESDTVVDDDQ